MPKLNYALYDPRTFEIDAIDYSGKAIKVASRIFSRAAIARRRVPVLVHWLTRAKAIRKVRVGNSKILMVEVARVVALVQKKADNGQYFVDNTPA